jgi:hypothetical protein
MIRQLHFQQSNALCKRVYARVQSLRVCHRGVIVLLDELMPVYHEEKEVSRDIFGGAK